jgi:acetylornithine deacetylase/succinyl-diaminopimelate desuccinylase-like protein
MVKVLAGTIGRLADEPRIAKARALLRRTDDTTVEEQLRIAMIASPPFGEDRRGEWVAARFADIGLSNVHRDGEGNVLGTLAGTGDSDGAIIVAAHLDTVFPADTPLHVRKEGHRLYVPGIADNARGLAALLAIARALTATGVAPTRTIVLAGTTGEEGIGDLRGVKYLFREDGGFRGAAAFIALDGTDSRRIVTSAVGSKRFRIAIRGPGGHAWADRGSANAAHALGDVLAALSALRLPPRPAWSLNVGRIGGGTSINAIPEEAWLELDLRSEAGETLASLEEFALARVRQAVRSANTHRLRGTAALTVDVDCIGSRPAGRTRLDSNLVDAAKEATRYIGRRPEVVASSTDANVPMALGIPAIAIGAGGESGGMHTVGEWYDNRKGPDGIVRALLTIMAVAGQD